MPVSFTGSDNWETDITGPANGDDDDGPSVADMGVLLANRTMYLFNRRMGEAHIATDTSLSVDSVTAVYAVVAGLSIAFTIDVDSTVVVLLSGRITADANGAKVRLSIGSDKSEELFMPETSGAWPFSQHHLFFLGAGTHTLEVEFAEISGGGNATLQGPATLAMLAFGNPSLET